MMDVDKTTGMNCVHLHGVVTVGVLNSSRGIGLLEKTTPTSDVQLGLEPSSNTYVNGVWPDASASLATSVHQEVHPTFSAPPGSLSYVEPWGYHDHDRDAIAMIPGQGLGHVHQSASLNSQKRNVSTATFPPTPRPHWNLHHVTNPSYAVTGEFGPTSTTHEQPSNDMVISSEPSSYVKPEEVLGANVNVGDNLDDGYLPDVVDDTSVSSTSNPSYAYAYDAPPIWRAPKVFTNSYGQLENIYEEINDLQRQRNTAGSNGMLKSKTLISPSTASPRYVVSMTERWTAAVPPVQVHRRSLVEEVLDEVARVQQKHQTALGQLNLDVENLLMPDSPEQSHNNEVEQPLNLSSTAIMAGSSEPSQGAHVGLSNRRCGASNHVRSVSSASFEQLTHHSMPTFHGKLSRCESLDFKEALQRRSSASAVLSSTLTAGRDSEANSRQSLRNLQEGLHQSFQDLQEFRDKCSQMWNRRGKKAPRFQGKDRRSICDSGPNPEPPDPGGLLHEGANHHPTTTQTTTTTETMANGHAPSIATTMSHQGKSSNFCNGVVDYEGEQRIYEDIDREPHEADEADGDPLSTRQFPVRRLHMSSDDSWGSGEFESFSSDEEERGNESKLSTTTLKAFLTAKSLRDKWKRTKDDKMTGIPNQSMFSSDSPPPPERRFSRLFSLRRSSQTDTTSTESGGSSQTATRNGTLPLLEEEEWQQSLGLHGSMSSLFQRRHQPPTLPPVPNNLTPEQLKRRYIVATIVHSENNYVATLQRLVSDFKKPLEESHPPILSPRNIASLFHRLPEILQCHTLFRIALAECVRTWDKEEKIGDVFVASFSKAVVLDIYSDFINNFSVAMEVAKQEAKRKSAFADFLKVKQITAHDRLSFFGLMVKPVQRFPQFILLLQDLLKHTPQGHHDRMSLQLALTQLESLAEMLNERKREAEQYQAFKETLRRVSGKFSLRPLADNNRYLLRQDTMTLVELNALGLISKTKERRVLLLNDLLVCLTIHAKDGNEFQASAERLTLKWAYPVSDVEVEDTSATPTLSRLLSAGGTGVISKPGETLSTVDALCQDMNLLMHDYQVISRISGLIGTLKGNYPGISAAGAQEALSLIQKEIQTKDEEMAWLDACCLQLLVRTKGKEERFLFHTETPALKQDWLTELRLAQLALHPKNVPSWDVCDPHRKPWTKMPLFVEAHPVYRATHVTEVHCACFYTIHVIPPRGRGPPPRPRPQSFLWVISGDGLSSHVCIYSMQLNLQLLHTFSIMEAKVSCCEFTPAVQSDEVASEMVWMGTESGKLLVYLSRDTDPGNLAASALLPGAIVQLQYHCTYLFVGLDNGTVAWYKRSPTSGTWDLSPAALNTVSVSSEPVTSLLPIGSSLYVASGKSVYVLDAVSGNILRSFAVSHESGSSIGAMAHAGIGLWLSLKNSPVVCLYHSETFRHLQDISVASNVARVLPNIPSQSVHVTTIAASKGWLWVGTNVGVALTLPLPRLEGVPIISGRANVSFHAHAGPINFFLPLTKKVAIPEIPKPVQTIEEENEDEIPNPKEFNSSGNDKIFNTVPRMKPNKNAQKCARTLPRHASFLNHSAECDVYGLYGDLMNVTEYEDSEEIKNGGPLYETLRRSDPDVANLPQKISTLDRRVHMKAARPRSLDLSNWSVDSRSSAHTNSSGSEENAFPVQSAKLPGVPMPGKATGGSGTLKTNKSSHQTLKKGDAPRTLMTIMGGKGSLHLKKGSTLAGNSSDAHIVLWESKV